MTKHRDELLTRVRGGVTLGPSRRARLRQAIVGGVVGAGAAGAAQAAAAQAASLPMVAIPTSLKVLAVALVATGGLAWGLSRGAPDPSDGVVDAEVAAAPSEAPAPATPTAPTVAAPEVSPAPAAVLAPSPPSPVAPLVAPLVARRDRAPRDRAPRDRGVAPRVEEAEPAVIPAVEAEVPEATDPIGRETALLRNARSALARADVGRAVSLLDEHARDFPDGALAEARDLLRVQARCVAGDGEGAAREAAHFVDAHPSSPHARRMASPCEGRPAR